MAALSRAGTADEGLDHVEEGRLVPLVHVLTVPESAATDLLVGAVQAQPIVCLNRFSLSVSLMLSGFTTENIYKFFSTLSLASFAIKGAAETRLCCSKD